MKQIIISYLYYFEPMSPCKRISTRTQRISEKCEGNIVRSSDSFSPRSTQYSWPFDSMGLAQSKAGWQNNWLVHRAVQLVHRQLKRFANSQRTGGLVLRWTDSRTKHQPANSWDVWSTVQLCFNDKHTWLRRFVQSTERFHFDFHWEILVD